MGIFNLRNALRRWAPVAILGLVSVAACAPAPVSGSATKLLGSVQIDHLAELELAARLSSGPTSKADAPAFALKA